MVELQQPLSRCRKRKASEPQRNVSPGRIRIREMMTSESMFRKCEDQIALEANMQPSQLNVWRERVAQWFYDVVDHLEVSREIVYIAMNFLDRYIVVDTSLRCMSKEKYELISTTCLFLSVKASGNPNFKVVDLLQMSQSRLQVKDIHSTGARILQLLSLKHRIVTPAAFIEGYLKLLQGAVPNEKVLSVYEMASYLVEMSVCDSYFSRIAPSKIAFAAISFCTSEQGGCRIERKVRHAFMEALERESGLLNGLEETRTVCERMESIYTDSQETMIIQTPNIILDEADDAPSCRLQSSPGSLISLIPCTPITSEFEAILPRSLKRARLHY